MKIIDSHHHLWDLQRFPYAWLSKKAPARPFGDHTAIKRDYLGSDYRHDFQHHDFVGSVFIQANSDAAQPVEEIAFADDQAEKYGLNMALVGWVDLRRTDVLEQIKRQAEFPRFRGIRLFAGYDDDPKWRQNEDPHFLSSEMIYQIGEYLEQQGHSLDVVVFPRQLEALSRLAKRFPALRIAINHLAMLRPQLAGEAAYWSDGIDAIASHENVALKISGLWTIDRNWTEAGIAPFVNELIEKLGADRLMYGSNMPVEGVMIGIDEQIDRLKPVIRDHGPNTLDAIFRSTAKQFYQLA